MLQKKICLIGYYRVGKTSLVSQFVHSMFSAKYHTTVGVKVDKKVVTVCEKSIKLMVWDLQGEDEEYRINTNYLRGASGLVFVADCTRPETVAVLDMLNLRASACMGSIPRVVAINKVDILDPNNFDVDVLERSSLATADRFYTSAKTGEQVNEMLTCLATRIYERTLL